MVWLDSPHSGAGDDGWRLCFTQTNIKGLCIYESVAANDTPRLLIVVFPMCPSSTAYFSLVLPIWILQMFQKILPRWDLHWKIVQNSTIHCNLFDAKAQYVLLKCFILRDTSAVSMTTGGSNLLLEFWFHERNLDIWHLPQFDNLYLLLILKTQVSAAKYYCYLIDLFLLPDFSGWCFCKNVAS